MRVTRSYWMGLGSGLILSALLALVFHLPQKGQAVAPRTSTLENSSVQNTTPIVSSETKSTDQSKEVQPSTSTKSEREFVIPNGASAEKIADLLLTQGFITDKQGFLNSVNSKKIQNKFIAGTYTLHSGLTFEELLGRLVRN